MMMDYLYTGDENISKRFDNLVEPLKALMSLDQWHDFVDALEEIINDAALEGESHR